MKRSLIQSKISLLLLSLALLLGSCEIIDPFINPPKDGCILQKTTWSIPDDPAHGHTDYNYDASGKLIEILITDYDLGSDPCVGRWEMTYSNDTLDRIDSFIKISGSQEQKTGNWAFQYSNNRPDTIRSQATEYFLADVYTVIEYSGDKLSKFNTYRYSTRDTLFQLYSTTDIEWTGDNISKVTITNSSGSQLKYEYEYDDKNAPIAHVGIALTSFGSITMLSKNNVTKTTYTLGSNVYIYETSYSYNDAGYPITSTPLDGYATNYEYDCK